VTGLRLLFVSSLHQAPWGAAEELWAQAAVAAVAAGHDVQASVHGWDHEVGGQARLRAGGVALEVRAGGLGDALDRDDWDLVVVNQPDVFSGAPWTRACAARALPYVVIVHYAAAHSWRPDAVALDAGAGLAGAVACLFVSQATWRWAEVQTGRSLPQGEVVLAPYRVPYDGGLAWPSGPELRLAMVGRVDTEDKGHDLLLHLLAEPRWRDRPVRLDVVGEGPHEALLRRLAALLGLSPRVRFRGHVDDVPSVWRDAHVAVMPSRAEGMPAALFEAMLCGRPAVVTDVGGMATLVDEAVTGHLASAPTVAALGAAMERLWAGREQLQAMGARARTRARSATVPDPAGALVVRLERAAVAAARPTQADERMVET
jgi:glycosyltransferase involved in cell wall biosynthesis